MPKGCWSLNNERSLIVDVPFRTVEISDPAFEQGLRFVTVKSPALGRRADCTIWVPSLPSSPAGKGVEPVATLLILLHGVYGSAWVWPLKAGVHRTAQRMLEQGEIGPMVIAMPSDGLHGDGSGYLTHPGLDVERWIVEEVPALARLAAPGLRRDARLAIAGLSMGGYGALRIGAKYSHRFSAISAHSAITEIAEMSSFVEEPLQSLTALAPAQELSAMYWLLQQRDSLPALRFDCGLADALLDGNRTLHRKLLASQTPHTYEEFQGGHEWAYWAEHVERTLKHVSAHAAS